MASGGSQTRGETLVSSAISPSRVPRVLMLTKPAGVWKTSSSAGVRSTSAIADAMVA